MGHTPVLLEEVLDFLALREGGVYVDGTAGRGGHSAAILGRIGASGRLLAIDRDPEAVERLRRDVRLDASRCQVVHGNFSAIGTLARDHGFSEVDGVLLDLGVSSDQLDTAERGFSFRGDGPLDMRMNPDTGETAADLVNGLSEKALADLIWRFGEEPRSRRIARRLVAMREEEAFRTTKELAEAVFGALGGRRGRIHPATRTFQALRMAVNCELACLEDGLAGGLSILKTGGRLAVISFHSLEDRIVKQFFVRHEGRWESLQAGGRRWEGERPRMRRITRKPARPGESEIQRNPRSRSALLRAAERIEADGT